STPARASHHPAESPLTPPPTITTAAPRCPLLMWLLMRATRMRCRRRCQGRLRAVRSSAPGARKPLTLSPTMSGPAPRCPFISSLCVQICHYQSTALSPALSTQVFRAPAAGVAQRRLDQGFQHEPRDRLHLAIARAPDVPQHDVRLDAVDQRQRLEQPIVRLRAEYGCERRGCSMEHVATMATPVGLLFEDPHPLQRLVLE